MSWLSKDDKAENYKFLIVEDEVLIAEDLKDNLVSFGIKRIEMAHDKNDALNAIEIFNPDVVLLDVRLERNIEGIEIAEHLLKKQSTPFIYITAHSDAEMIRQIIKTKPLAYITKPIRKTDLFAAVSLAIEQINSIHSRSLMIKDGYSSVFIPFESIVYVESEGNYINIICDEKKYVARQSLDSVLADLNMPQFFRIHRSYLVNTLKVSRFSKKEVHIGNVVLPLSRGLSKEFEQHITKHNSLSSGGE